MKPTLPGLVLAPINATEFGLNKALKFRIVIDQVSLAGPA
jgi:hypothetical protein